MRIWRSINITLIRDLPLLTFLLPSYSSSSMSSSMSNMFIRHRTSVALLCRLADRSRPGICIWAGIMFIASGWRIKKGKKKNWTIWFKVFTLIQLINPSVCRSASSALLLYLPLTLFMLVLAPTLALWTINFFSPSCMPLSPVIACIERNSSTLTTVKRTTKQFRVDKVGHCHHFSTITKVAVNVQYYKPLTTSVMFRSTYSQKA